MLRRPGRLNACVPSSLVMRVEAGAVEGDAIEMALQRRFLRGGKIDEALASSTAWTPKTSHSPFVNCASCLPSRSYK